MHHAVNAVPGLHDLPGYIGSEKARISDEVNARAFEDLRLGKRLDKLIEALAKRTGDTLPLACQDWAATKWECRHPGA